MDFIVEQVVPRSRPTSTLLKKISIISGVILIPLLIGYLGLVLRIVYLFIIAMFIFLFGLYAAWFLWTSLQVDFEYSVSGNTLTVDKVISNRKRKRVLKLEISSIEDMRQFNKSNLADKTFHKTFSVSGTENGDDVYGAVFSSSAQGGNCLLLFSPNEKILKAMKLHLRRDIWKNISADLSV